MEIPIPMKPLAVLGVLLQVLLVLNGLGFGSFYVVLEAEDMVFFFGSGRVSGRALKNTYAVFSCHDFSPIAIVNMRYPQHVFCYNRILGLQNRRANGIEF